MQKLTRTTWFKTIKQDLTIIFRLLWEAFKCFIMFDYGGMRLNLIVAGMMFWGEVVREDDDSES